MRDEVVVIPFHKLASALLRNGFILHHAGAWRLVLDGYEQDVRQAVRLYFIPISVVPKTMRSAPPRLRKRSGPAGSSLKKITASRKAMSVLVL